MAHGDTLSRLRYSVHARPRLIGQRQRAHGERAVEPRFVQRRIEAARAIGGGQRARQIVGPQSEPRAFELHGGHVAQILRIGRLLARCRQQRLRGIVIAARQQLRDAQRVQLRRCCHVRRMTRESCRRSKEHDRSRRPGHLAPQQMARPGGMREPPG